MFGGIKHIANATKIANSLSGVQEATKHADDAYLAFKAAPLVEKGGSMATREIAYNVSKMAVESLNHAQQIFTVTKFLVSQGYRLGEVGLKLLIGNVIKGWL